MQSQHNTCEHDELQLKARLIYEIDDQDWLAIRILMKLLRANINWDHGNLCLEFKKYFDNDHYKLLLGFKKPEEQPLIDLCHPAVGFQVIGCFMYANGQWVDVYKDDYEEFLIRKDLGELFVDQSSKDQFIHVESRRWHYPLDDGYGNDLVAYIKYLKSRMAPDE